MASMNLIPELKKETDRLYYSDPVKFKPLAKWIAQGRKGGATEPEMAETLRRFWDYRVIDGWYEYLDEILENVIKDRNRDEFLEQHEKNKKEMKQWAENAQNGDDPVSRMVRELANEKKI